MVKTFTTPFSCHNLNCLGTKETFPFHICLLTVLCPLALATLPNRLSVQTALREGNQNHFLSRSDSQY